MTKTVNHRNDTPFFGDSELLEVAQKNTFANMIFELLSGKTSTEAEAKLFELILNISIDHGPEAPSAASTIQAAKEGKSISEAVADGIRQINDTHGGAMEPAMDLFYKIEKEKLNTASLVDEYLSEGKRMPGFGHRIYEVDPRAELILNEAEKAGIGGEFSVLARKIETELKNKKGKPIPINVDGAIAVVLCGFGWPSELGKAVFLSARTPGLSAQFLNAKNGK